MYFYFVNDMGFKVFSSENLEEVEVEARKFKEDNKILALQIKVDKGKFYKWA